MRVPWGIREKERRVSTSASLDVRYYFFFDVFFTAVFFLAVFFAPHRDPQAMVLHPLPRNAPFLFLIPGSCILQRVLGLLHVFPDLAHERLRIWKLFFPAQTLYEHDLHLFSVEVIVEFEKVHFY